MCPNQQDGLVLVDQLASSAPGSVNADVIIGEDPLDDRNISGRNT